MLVSPAKKGLQTESCYDSFSSCMAKINYQEPRWLGVNWFLAGYFQEKRGDGSYWQGKDANNRY